MVTAYHKLPMETRRNMENSQRLTRRYHSFVLNLWQEGSALPNAPPVWRFSLTHPHSGERTGFRSIEDLLAFLQNWTQSPDPVSKGENDVDC
jgi:hypothetical protein